MLPSGIRTFASTLTERRDSLSRSIALTWKSRTTPALAGFHSIVATLSIATRS